MSKGAFAGKNQRLEIGQAGFEQIPVTKILFADSMYEAE